MGILDRFRKNKKEEVPALPSQSPPLPQDLERFRTPATSFDRPIQVPERPAPLQSPPVPEPPVPSDRAELIIQKLDTIDARLRFIEEKLKKF